MKKHLKALSVILISAVIMSALCVSAIGAGSMMKLSSLSAEYKVNDSNMSLIDIVIDGELTANESKGTLISFSCYNEVKGKFETVKNYTADDVVLLDMGNSKTVNTNALTEPLLYIANNDSRTEIIAVTDNNTVLLNAKAVKLTIVEKALKDEKGNYNNSLSKEINIRVPALSKATNNDSVSFTSMLKEIYDYILVILKGILS